SPVIGTPVLVLLLAQLVTTYPRAIAAVAIAGAVSVGTLHRMYGWVSTVGQFEAAPRDLGPLVTTLDRLGLERVYANYWIAYRLDFDTKERIVAANITYHRVTFR